MILVQQRGVAIVLAMGIVALATMAATAIMTTQSSWARQSELTADYIQARELVQAGVDWARAVLKDDRRASNVDHSGEPWALRLPPIPVQNGKLSGFIVDQQGAFNLNNLVVDGKASLSQLEHFRRLLQSLQLPITLADALADWLDADGTPQPEAGAEDAYYLALQPPYLAANRPLTDVAELALVRGFDQVVLTKLRPYVTALPNFTAVNVNTATPQVLAAIMPKLDLNAARMLVLQRERAYFRDISDFSARLPSGVTANHQDINVSSDFFFASVQVSIGLAQSHSTALLARRDDQWPVVVWRKYQ